jgi:hypothetical protein
MIQAIKVRKIGSLTPLAINSIVKSVIPKFKKRAINDFVPFSPLMDFISTNKIIDKRTNTFI